MKSLSAEKIQENYKTLRNIITMTFSGERLEKLNVMYDYYEDGMTLAPASAKEHHHKAMVDGYVEYV